MDVCLLRAGGVLAESLPGFCAIERTAIVLGLCEKQDFGIPALGAQSVSAGYEPV